MIDLCTLPGTASSYSHANGINTLDFNTATQMNRAQSSGWVLHTFDKAYDVVAVSVWLYAHGNRDEEGTEADANAYCQYTLDGIAWTTFPTAKGVLWDSLHRSGRGDVHLYLQQIEYAIEVADVVGVRLTTATRGENEHFSDVFEFHAFGTPGPVNSGPPRIWIF